jgi:hypothetical protein
VFCGIPNSNSAVPFKVPSVSNGSFQNVPIFGNDLKDYSTVAVAAVGQINRRIIVGDLEKNIDTSLTRSRENKTTEPPIAVHAEVVCPYGPSNSCTAESNIW